MNRDDILAALRDLLRAQKQTQFKAVAGSITPETRIDAIGFDSLSILDFMYEVEDRFGIRTEPAELVNLEKVQDLVDYLAAKVTR